MSSRKASLLGAVAFFGLNLGTEVRAQAAAADSAAPAALQTVTVTAERRKSSVQKTAASISVRSGEDLKMQGKFTASQILEDVPGVSTLQGLALVAQSDQPGSAIVIRGVPPNSGAAGNATIPTTAVYTDDIYSGIGGDYDIASVQVLRGPQGTLYGRSATAGVVATTTNNPVLGKFGGEGSIEVGSFDLLHYTGALNVPITDGLALRVAGNEYQQNGSVFKKGGRHVLSEGKVKLLYQPNSDLSVLLGAAVQEQHLNNGGGEQLEVSPNVVENTTTINGQPATTLTAEDHFRQFWADVNYNLGFANLTYIPAFRTWNQNSPSIGQGPFGNTNYGTTLTPLDQFQTQELRLASDPGSKLTWIGGVFYYFNKYHNINDTQAVKPGYSPQTVFDTDLAKETTDVGLFGDATYPITSSLSLTGGLRWDYTRVSDNEDYTTGADPFNPQNDDNSLSTTHISGKGGENIFRNFTFRVRLEDQFTPNNEAYATISSGFLPGDVQATTKAIAPGSLVSVAAAVPYAEETLHAYEIGSKNRFLDNRLQANGDVFYYDYSGYQSSIRGGITNIVFLTLTTPARMYGGELELSYLLTPEDKVSLAYNYINARYTSPSQLNAADVGNITIPDIPPNQVTINYSHTFDLADGSSVVAGGDMRYVDGYGYSNLIEEYYTGQCGPTGTQSCVAYNQIHAQVIGDINLTWSSSNQKYSVTGYVRNVGDNQYMNSSSLSGGNAGGTGGFSATATTYQPRTFGLVLNGKF